MSYIIWKGTNSSTIPGLMICELPPISKPKMKTKITKIDGRDGDIVEELGYESYTKTIQIGLTNNYDINEIIKYFSGSGSLTLSNESDKEYICTIVDKVDYEKLLRFKKANVKFYTQPFKYLKDEEPVDLTIDDEESVVVENMGLEKSKPIVHLFGSGTIRINVDNWQVFNYTFPENETEVIIDSSEEEAYLNGVFKNRNMVGSFLTLEPGENTISWTGSLTRIIIEPKSRWL